LLVALYLRLFTDVTQPGWTSLIVISLLFHGITLTLLGVLGEYVGRIYEETKGRPLYLTAEKINLDENGAGREHTVEERAAGEAKSGAERADAREGAS